MFITEFITDIFIIIWDILITSCCIIVGIINKNLIVFIIFIIILILSISSTIYYFMNKNKELSINKVLNESKKALKRNKKEYDKNFNVFTNKIKKYINKRIKMEARKGYLEAYVYFYDLIPNSLRKDSSFVNILEFILKDFENKGFNCDIVLVDLGSTNTVDHLYISWRHLYEKEEKRI